MVAHTVYLILLLQILGGCRSTCQDSTVPTVLPRQGRDLCFPAAWDDVPGHATVDATSSSRSRDGTTREAFEEALVTLFSFLSVLGIGLWLKGSQTWEMAAVLVAKPGAQKATSHIPSAQGEVGLTGATEEKGHSHDEAQVHRIDAGEFVRLTDDASAPVITEASYRSPEGAEESQQLLSVLRACAARRRFSEALAAYDDVASDIGEACHGVWSLLLYSAVSASEFQRCEAFFNNLCQLAEPSGHDFLNMVHYFVHCHDLDGLRQMLHYLCGRGVQVDGINWNRALATCTTAGLMRFAEALVASGSREGAMDAVAYNTLMKGHVRSGDTQRCFEYYKEMQVKGVQPTNVTFGVLLGACHEADDFARAKQVFEDLQRCGLKPNAVHCTTIMKCLTRLGRLEEAEQVLRWMLRSPDSTPDLVTYSMLVKARAEHGDLVGSLRLLQEMIGRGIQPDTVVLHSALCGCCTANVAPLELRCVLLWLMDRGLRPTSTTLSILIKALAGQKAWDEAFRLLVQAPEKFGVWPEARIYVQLANACAKVSEGERALQAYAAMVQAATRQGTYVGRPANSRLLSLCCSFGNSAAFSARQINQLVQEAGFLVQPNDMVDSLAATPKRRDNDKRVAGPCAAGHSVRSQRQA